MKTVYFEILILISAKKTIQKGEESITNQIENLTKM
jgi:hypothetical protein